MRKLKLLIAACALLVCAGAQAQKDVTSQYITNATLSSFTAVEGEPTVITGWKNVNFNKPQQGNNTVGYASESYAGWDNIVVKNYSLTQTITLPAGHYTLVNYSFYRYGLNADTDPSLSYAKLKAGSAETEVKTLGSITAAGYANSQAEGANAFDSKMYRNTVDFTIDTDGTSIEIGLVGTHELKQSWMICGMFELINNDIPATMDAPFDVTGYITNPGFEYRDMTGWTQTPSGFFGTQSNNQPFKVGGCYGEKWQQSGALPEGSMSQTLTNLPAGYYKLTANLGGDGTYINLNGKTANWTADKDYTVGYVLADGEDLTITAGKTAEGTANWVHFDNFRLYFCGDVAAALTTLCAEVTKYESILPAAAYAQLQNDVASYNKNYTDVDELLDAIDAVQDLYDTADEYVKAVTAYNNALAAVQEMKNSIPTAAYYALTQTINQFKVTSGTTDDFNNAAVAINQARGTFEPLVEPYATWLVLKENALVLATGHTTITGAINKVAQFVETITTVAELEEANSWTIAMTSNYSAWYELKQKADALKAVSNNNATANNTLGEAISTQESSINTQATEINNTNPSTQDQIEELKNKVKELINTTIPTATSNLKTAMTTYVTTAEPTNDECFDLTFLIVNPHFKEGQGGTAIPTGWTLESGAITEHRLATHNFEAFHTPFNLSQTIPNLQKGTYKVTLQGFARHDNADVTDKTNLYCGIVNQPIKSIKDEYSTKPLTSGKPALGDNNGEASYDLLNGTTVYQPNGMSGSCYYFQETNPATEKPFYTNEVQTLISSAGDLKIGFKCDTNSDWVIWDNFHLYYYGSAIAVTLDEATGTSYSKDIENANVTLKKTIYQGWNTITVPFEATANAFGADALYKYTGDTEEGILNFEEAVTIEPNVPYLLNVSENGIGTYTFNGVTVKAADGQTTEGTNYDFVGIYQEATVAEGDYILGEDAFYRSKGGNKVKAYRAYVKAKSDDPSNARLKIAINGVVTAIDTIDGQAVNNAAIYNLAGQKVERAQKGIYIQNGKKVVVK